MTQKEIDDIIVRFLNTPEGKKKFRAVFEPSAAKAADNFKKGSVGYKMGRMLAGLPLK